MKTGAIQKLIGAIPGIGQGVNSVAQMVLGSGVLIKKYHWCSRHYRTSYPFRDSPD